MVFFHNDKSSVCRTYGYLAMSYYYFVTLIEESHNFVSVMVTDRNDIRHLSSATVTPVSAAQH